MISLSLFVLMVYNPANSAVIIDSHCNECTLDPKLISEIASYKNVTKQIIDEIVANGAGKEMYNKYVEFLNKFGARPSGTAVLENAIDYMINLTHHSGVHDVTTEEIDAPLWLRLYESAKMLEPRPKRISILGLGSSVSTPEQGIEAEVIVIRSFKEMEEMDESLIKGKIVLFDPHYTTYGETVIYRTQSASKASKKGAVATLVRSITPFSINSPHTGWQSYDDDVVKIPTAAITLEDADLMRRLQDSGTKIVVRLKLIYSSEMKKSRNTIIDLKGKLDSTKQVIVSGHIDSWDVGDGAMDDGGGMMISWFTPVVLKHLNLTPRRTIRAILWTSEEPGLVGAAHYLKRHKHELSNINFIMESDEGTFKPLGLEVAGSKTARCIIAEILKLFPETNKLKVSDGPGSDIVLFIKEGIPGASLTNANERYFWFHHSEGDTLNVQDMKEVINCAAFWAAVSYVIADISEDIPRY